MAVKSKSRLAREVVQYADVLATGRLLAIDPASGASSMPGFAVFERGQLVAAGVLEIPRRELANRLWYIAECIRTELPKPDIMCVELISPVMPSKGGGGFINKGSGSLLKSVGAILSVHDVPILEVAPVTWQTMKPPEYVKSDAWDAAMIGWAAYIMLARETGAVEPIPRFSRGA